VAHRAPNGLIGRRRRRRLEQSDKLHVSVFRSFLPLEELQFQRSNPLRRNFQPLFDRRIGSVGRDVGSGDLSGRGEFHGQCVTPAGRLRGARLGVLPRLLGLCSLGLERREPIVDASCEASAACRAASNSAASASRSTIA
jgi:hypothetical protein